jgi:microcystin-dependent protein
LPRNGSGTYSLPEAAFVPATTISSAAVNDDFADIALALTGSLATDGQSTMTGALKAAAGTATNPSYSFGSDLNTGLYSAADGVIGVSSNGSEVGTIGPSGFSNTAGIYVGIPVGFIGDFAGSTAPSGWLLCGAQVVSQTTYALLFAVIGTAYNTGGEGAGNFRLPDYRGRTGFGVDNMGGSAANRVTNAVSGIVGTTEGATGGSQSATISEAQLPAVSHTLTGTATATISGTATATISGTVTPTFTGTPATWALNSNNVDLGITGIQQGTGAGAQGVTSSGTPNVTVTPAGTISAINGSSFTNSAINGASFTNSAINGSSFTYSFGSGTALPIMPPTIMVNKIIFAGI